MNDKKVLLASVSPPFAFPPVEIDGHLFAKDLKVRQPDKQLGAGPCGV